jgi:hypothetical protein
VDNSIRLKELQILTAVLGKGDEGLEILFYSLKEFFWVRRGGWDKSTPFQRKFFFKGLGEVKFFWDWD